MAPPVLSNADRDALRADFITAYQDSLKLKAELIVIEEEGSARRRASEALLVSLVSFTVSLVIC